MHTVLAANEDNGGAVAMVPALKKLSETCRVVALGDPSSPGFKVFKGAGFEVRQPGDYGCDSNRMFAATTAAYHAERPHLAFVGVSVADDAVETHVLHAARVFQVPSVAIYETWPHGRHLLRSKMNHHYGEITRLLTLDENSRREFITYGFEENRVVVTGNPAYDSLAQLAQERDALRRKTREQLNIGLREVVLTFCTGALDPIAGTDDSNPLFLGFSEAQAVTDFLDIGQEITWTQPVQILRLHPNENVSHIEKLNKGRVRLVTWNEVRDGRPLLLASDMVFSTTSSMSEIAAFLGIPSFMYMPGLKVAHPMFSNCIGLTWPLYDRSLLHLLLTRCTLNELESLHRAARSHRVPAEATQHVVDEIQALLA